MSRQRIKLSRPVKRGMALLFLFSFCGIGVLVASAGGADSLNAFSSLNPLYIVACLALVALDLFMGALRNHIFVRKIKPGTGFSLSFRANVANMFMGAITPSQGLGGPAQLAVLKLGGIPIGAAVSVSVLNFIGTILFFGAGVSAALLLFHHWIVTPAIRTILWGCAGLFFLAFLMLTMALTKPSLLKKLFSWLATAATRLFRVNSEKVSRYEELISGKVDDYHQWCLKFLVKYPGVVILSVILTVLLYLNKFTIYWLVARGLGLGMSWGSLFASLYLITFISYFAPSPGAGGVAEVATGILLAPVIPGSYLPLFTLLGRMFILFIPAGVGFAAVMGTLKKDSGFLNALNHSEKKTGKK